MRENKQPKKLNALLQKKSVTKAGKHYVNLVLIVVLDNGEVVTFQVAPKFYNSKLNYKISKNIQEAEQYVRPGFYFQTST